MTSTERDLPKDMLEALRQELAGETGEKVMGKQTLFRMVSELLRSRDALASIRAERDAAVAALRDIVEPHYDEYGVIDVFSASDIVGTDSTGRKQLKGSFIETLERARAIAGEQKS